MQRQRQLASGEGRRDQRPDKTWKPFPSEAADLCLLLNSSKDHNSSPTCFPYLGSLLYLKNVAFLIQIHVTVSRLALIVAGFAGKTEHN